VGEAADNLTLLQCLGSLTVLGHLYHLREVLVTVGQSFDVLPAGETCRVGSEDTLRIVGVGQWRNDAVGGEDDRTVEV